MGRCANCRKRTHLGMTCKWCEQEHCVHCIQPELHSCLSMDTMKKQTKLSLRERLMHEKTVSEKMIKI